MNTIYFTSDLHFNHNRPFIYSNRGFTSMEDYENKLIENFNKVIHPKDTVYHLGDFAKSLQKESLDKLQGKWIFIEGNHDKELFKNINQSNKFSAYQTGFLELKIDHQLIVLCHYPMLCWNKSHWNSWHLYGHVHEKELPIKGKLFDVSPKKDFLFPYSYSDIVTIMNNLPDNWDLIKKD
jgi:calcineurin-like phosphoesterase family protein